MGAGLDADDHAIFRHTLGLADWELEEIVRNLSMLITGGLLVACVQENDFVERIQSDSWFQAPNNQVDILWVVDDSCSMGEEQQTLANGFSSFVQQMEASQTDFHLGVISTSFDETDTMRGVLIGDPPYLTSEDEGFEEDFIGRAQVGIDGSDKEKGLAAAEYALSPALTSSGPNAGFVRADAQLLVVFVTDEEDCSDGGALFGQPAEECYKQDELLVPVTSYVQSYRDLKDSGDMVQVGAIVGVQNAACDDAFPGSRYIQTAALLGGLVGDICLADWSTMLSDLGLNATGIRTSFQTTHLARVDTLKVWVNEVEIPQDPTSGWTYDEATWYIEFAPSAVPERDASIVAEYKIQPGVNAPEVTSTTL